MRFNVPVLALEGSPTADGRLFDRFDWRELPLPLMLQDTGAHGGEAGPSLAAGTIETIGKGEGGAVTAVIDTDDEGTAGAEAARLIQAEVLTGISIDYSWADDDLEMECTEEDDDGWCVSMTIHWKLATIMGATIVPFPAFAEARIDPSPLDAAGDEDAEPEEAAARVASLALAGTRAAPRPRTRLETVDYPGDTGEALAAAGSLLRPPAEWFADPALPGPTRLTITDEGQVFGHVAFWDACHVSYPDRCVPPPRSSAGYPHFRTGSRVVAGGTAVRTGPLVTGADHAPVRGPGSDAAGAIDHYAHNACAWADVAAGDDAHGVWVAGALRPGVTEEQLVAVRGSAPSGDWRKINGRYEMVAVLSVNTPGFRDALAAAGSEVATASDEAIIIVTPAPCLTCDDEAETAATVASLDPETATVRRVLAHSARAALRARLRAS